MILKFDLYMRQLRETRRIHMYLPDDYLEHKEGLPVLYMFDGHNLFNDEDATYGKSWNLAHQAVDQGRSIIIVGQECSHKGNNRLAEYGPYPFYDPDFGSFEGLGNKTMDFFVHDLKPYIDQHFPTLPDRAHTFIGGSSCGGLMALYAAYHYSNTYSKALAISPFLGPSIGNILYDSSTSYIHKNTSVYFSWGAQEGRGHEFVNETKNITDIANILLSKGVRLHFNCKPLGRHREADWENESYDFFSFLLDK